MKSILVFSIVLLFFVSGQLHAQQISPEEKAQQAAENMQKRLGLKEIQLQQIYSLNLSKIHQVRTVKTEKADNSKKLDRHYQAISEAYNLRLRSILTPEQYQRWEVLRSEAQERRKVIQTNLVADNRSNENAALTDPETEFEHLVTH